MNWLRKFLGSPGKPYHRAPAIFTEQQRQRVNTERLHVLAGRPESDPLWQVVLSYADEHAHNELAVALSPGLSDSDRQFNAGRASSAEDFALALRDLHRKAQLDAARHKNR
jgi:hypothetical protein